MVRIEKFVFIDGFDTIVEDLAEISNILIALSHLNNISLSIGEKLEDYKSQNMRYCLWMQW